MQIKKIVLFIFSVFLVFSLYAQDKAPIISKKNKKKNSKMVNPTPIPTQTPVSTATPNPTLEALKKGEPCDTKEDLLKKLEEEKKKQKAFSLQGGNTGCSVDKK